MNLLTLTGPSGSGKTTLLNRLVAEHGYEAVVSHTTRLPRTGEIHGKDYYFVSDRQFDDIQWNQGFVESVTFVGNRYGVSLAEIERITKSNKKPILIVEPHGRNQISEYFKQGKLGTVLSVYITTHGTEALIDRYLGRLEEKDIKDPVLRTKHAARIRSITSEHNEWPYEGQWYNILYMDKPEDLDNNIKRILKSEVE